MSLHRESARQMFFDLVQIDSLSLEERKVADYCTQFLQKLGCHVYEDEAAQALSGQAGNLIARLPGDDDRPSILLTSHMDTVTPGNGIEPALDENGVVWSKGDTILGADDKAGITAILLAAQELAHSDEAHAPVEIVLTVCEEVGLKGSRQVDVSALQSREGLCLDSGGDVGTFVVAGPTQMKWNAEFVGQSAHAGVAPERGISAIKMAAAAVSRMPHGRVSANTTVNIGSFVGQGPTNVVRDKVTLVGEARGLAPQELNDVMAQIQTVFQDTAAELGGSVQFTAQKMYDGFSFDESHSLRERVENAISKVGLAAKPVRSGGGSDANIFTQNGIETINVAVGYEDIHSTNEHISLEDIVKVARIAVEFCRM